MEDAIELETVFKDNTEITDKYGNVLTIPAGFKVVSEKDDNTIIYADPNSPTVQDGIVIQDVNAGGKDNQFVWIPVGKIKKENDEDAQIIDLARYTFNEANEAGEATVNEKVTDGMKIDNYFYEDTEKGNYDNALAKDMEAFKNSVSSKKGYYLARFEASKGNKGEVKSVNVANSWVNISQTEASNNSINMYNNNPTKYESDLVNSYAWDTAIFFIQTYSEDKDYAKQKGETANMEANVDSRCNIYDMAGHEFEWSTETCRIVSYPCVYRGGHSMFRDDYTSYRHKSANSGFVNVSFRTILYIK